MQVALVLDTKRSSHYRFEGPTKREARKMAAFRRSLLESSAKALEAGEDECSFELDCQAWDMESDLRRFGFDVETGKGL